MAVGNAGSLAGNVNRGPVKLAWVCALAVAVLLSACGGGGGDNQTSSDAVVNPDPAPGQEPVPGSPAEPNPEPTPTGGLSYPGKGDPLVGVMGVAADWPLVPIHMGITPDGRMMSFGRESSDAAEMIYDIWDYREGTGLASHLTLPNRSGTDLFCANQLMLSSGVMLMTGGDTRADATETTIGYETGAGNRDATVFDPATNQVTRIGTMNEPRWYGTMIKLPSGEVFIQGGSTDKLENRARYTEIGSADGRVFTSLRGFSVYDLPWLYPRNFIDASGQVVGWAKRYSYRINPAGAGSRVDFGLAPQVKLEDGGLAVMYRPGKVLLAGGRSPRAVRADLDGAVPVYESVPPMSSPRIWGTATVLPDGKVLASNGGSNDTSALDAPLGEPARHIAIYDPASNSWLRGPSTRYPRLYHSASVLLPDATVLLGGGGLPGPVTNLNAEIYYPPYLFNADGSLAERPVITEAPQVLDPSAAFRFAVAAPERVDRVVLVKTGAVTHSFDMDQRFIELDFQRGSGFVKSSLPANPAVTTPGFYHLFVFNDAGVPSVSKIIRINPYTGPLPAAPLPGPVTKYIGLALQNDPAGFDLSCADDEVLVGVHGDQDEAILAIGPVCASYDAQMGELDAELIYRPAAGRMRERDNPLAFDKHCPVGQVVAGFGGAAAQRVEQLQLGCRQLAPAYGLAGPWVRTEALGGPGSQFITCPANKPATGIVGSTRIWDDDLTRFGLRCAPDAAGA